MAKEMYLAYFVFNLSDGSDLDVIGVYSTVEGALSALTEAVLDEFDSVIDDDILEKAVEDKYLFIEDDLTDASYGVKTVLTYGWRRAN